MLQFESIQVSAKQVVNVVCNACGNPIPQTSGGKVHEHLSIDKNWGYLSPYDGENHSFEICPDCYKKFIESFIVPVTVNTANVLI